MSTIGVWILVGVVFATLYLFWVVLGFTFDLIERALTDLRAEQAAADRSSEAAQTRKGTVI